MPESSTAPGRGSVQTAPTCRPAAAANGGFAMRLVQLECLLQVFYSHSGSHSCHVGRVNLEQMLSNLRPPPAPAQHCPP